jgi:hypothetical protein
MDIWNVVTVGQSVQTTAAKPSANSVWSAKVDIGGTQVDVMLKDEAPRRLTKELLGVGLADLLTVPHIPGWIASLDQAQAQAIGLTSNIRDPNAASRRLAFASKRSPGNPVSPGAKTVNMQLQRSYRSHSDAVPILVFDELVGNYDRQYENVMNEGANFLAFDHDKILFGDSLPYGQLPSVVALPCQCSVSDDIGFHAPGSKQTAQRLAASWASLLTAPIAILAELVQLTLLSSADAQAIEMFLLARLQHLPSLVDMHY